MPYHSPKPHRQLFHHLKPFQGLTLVELLVVIAIIGTLIGLLLPAVQAAREASRRITCTARQKEIALAVFHYHDANQSFPTGVSYEAEKQDCIGGFGRTLWTYAIMPFLELTAIREMIALHSHNGTPPDV
jgi:prepilin-type N-terminal cleavage/methylation domain-containing protein